MNNYEQLIDKLAAKLSVPAAHLWEILVRQARIEAVQSGLWIALAIAALVVMTRYAGKWYTVWRKADYDSPEEMAAFLAVFGGGVATTILTVVGVVQLFALSGYLFNPEYYALRQILSAVK